jgi:hypothetical protein
MIVLHCQHGVEEGLVGSATRGLYMGDSYERLTVIWPWVLFTGGYLYSTIF